MAISDAHHIWFMVCIFAENTNIFNFLWLFNVLMYAKANLDDDDDGFDWCVCMCVCVSSDLCEQTRLKTAVSVCVFASNMYWL